MKKELEKPVVQFMSEMKEAGFVFEFRAERFEDGMVLQSEGYLEEAEFIRQEKRRRATWH